MSRVAVQHPLVDTSADGVVVSASRGGRLVLTAGRADLFVRAQREGRRPVVVTTSDAVLSEPMTVLLRGSGGAWGVTDDAGTAWDGFTGRRLDRADLADGTPVTDPVDVADAWRPERPEALRVRVMTSRRHRNIRDAVLGADATRLGELLAGAPPAAWGVHEPCQHPWDRTALTAFARSFGEPLRMVIAGPRSARTLVGSVFSQRTRFGVEEETEVLVDLGPTGEDATALRALEAADAVQVLAAGSPLFAAAFADPGRADLFRAPRMPVPPWPLAVLFGAPVVRSLEIDAAALAQRHGGRVLGARRTPSLLVDIGDTDPGRSWLRLRALVEDIGVDRVLRSAPALARLFAGGAP